jgi:hypothetical protein
VTAPFPAQRRAEQAGEDRRDGVDQPYRDRDREADRGGDAYERQLVAQMGGAW